GLTGTFTIGSASGTNDFSLTAADLVVNVGEALTLTATGVQLNYESTNSASQTLISGKSASVTSAQFSGMGQTSISDFAIRTDGFSFGAFTWNSSAGVSIGNFLSATGVALNVSNFDFTFGASTPVSGTVGITISGLQLFPTGDFVQLHTAP